MRVRAVELQNDLAKHLHAPNVVHRNSAAIDASLAVVVSSEVKPKSAVSDNLHFRLYQPAKVLQRKID
jgi:hypothetical protein